MIVSATNVSVPLIAPSVNIQTEQTAKDNRARPPIEETHQLSKTNAERKIKEDDKRQRPDAWDPSEHPSYETKQEEDEALESLEQPKDTLERLFELLSLDTYSKNEGTEYTIRFQLPRKVLEEAIQEGLMEQRRTVIKYHYGHSVVPNTPSKTIAVL